MNDENIKGIEDSYRRELHHTRSAWIEPCNGAEVFEKAFPNLYQTGLHSLIHSARIIEKEVKDNEKEEKDD